MFLRGQTLAPWFQFTRPRGARPRPAVCAGRLAVSIHATTGGATGYPAVPPCAGRFQFTRPRGARPQELFALRQPAGFNSRAHGGRDPGRAEGVPRQDGFNSRAHGGRDASRARHPGRPRVSIHAPTGGATMPFRAYNLIYNVSIHAPTGGATRRCGHERNPRRRSHSRTNGGRDTQDPTPST